uniref:Uncharacterized protein n=1 Tax=Anguilla anguilla TaxID=7936 RepID=A0A0E9Q0G2_ANGAN
MQNMFMQIYRDTWKCMQTFFSICMEVSK